MSDADRRPEEVISVYPAAIRVEVHEEANEVILLWRSRPALAENEWDNCLRMNAGTALNVHRAMGMALDQIGKGSREMKIEPVTFDTSMLISLENLKKIGEGIK